MKIIWSPVALERVVEVGERIAHEQPLAAADWVSGIFGAVKRLNKFPRSGRVVPEARRADLRELLYGASRIIYRVEPERIVILTVRHSRQLLEPDDSEINV